MMQELEQMAQENQKFLDARIKECVSRGNFSEALNLANDYARHRMLRTWWEGGLLTPKNLPELLSFAWPIMGTSRSGIRWWVDMFKAAGFVSDDERVKRPESPLTVFRGCSPEFRFGLAWTTSLESAEWFAKEYYPVRVKVSFPAVYRAEVSTKHVLAIFNERKENEIVVNPWGLRSRVRIG